MKRFLIILAALVLAGCSKTETASQAEVTETQAQTTEENTETDPVSEITEETSESEASVSWQDAYRQKLLEFMESDEYSDAPAYFGNKENFEQSAFSICDLNADGVPELLISPGDYHAAACEIFVFDGGETVSLGSYGSFGSVLYYKDKNTVSSGYTGQGMTSVRYYALENNKLNLLAELFDNCGYVGKEKEATYKVNDVEVTKEEHDAERKKYSCENYISVGRDYTFKDIDRAFEEYEESDQ